MMEQGQRGALLARLDDLVKRAEKGEVATSDFLSPAEGHAARQYLMRKGAFFRVFGGYEDAERARIYVLPSYMEDAVEEERTIASLLEAFGYDCRIACLRVQGSGYASLCHRDFLGSLLALGLERSVIGDILVTEAPAIEALVFCDEPIVAFLLQEWKRVGNDAVKISQIPLAQVTVPERKYAPIHDTLASPRLDGVVAALCRLSRERAKAAVESGLVELDFEREERPDRTVGGGSILSVRGYGRFRILSVSEQTKKGRFRLEAQKYL